MTKRRKRPAKRYRIIADGKQMTRLGQTSFAKRAALEMVKDLKNRGYAARADEI
jgi:hypothetical protein